MNGESFEENSGGNHQNNASLQGANPMIQPSMSAPKKHTKAILAVVIALVMVIAAVVMAFMVLPTVTTKECTMLDVVKEYDKNEDGNLSQQEIKNPTLKNFKPGDVVRIKDVVYKAYGAVNITQSLITNISQSLKIKPSNALKAGNIHILPVEKRG